MSAADFQFVWTRTGSKAKSPAGLQRGEILNFDADVTIPTYPVWGPPPPMISFGFSYLVLDRRERQHWVYVAAGLSGGTWACETQGLGDRFTYREWRAGIGWEWGPPKSLAPMPGQGVKFETELDYVFGRTFEFEYRSDQIDVSNSLLLRTGVWF